MLFRSKAIQVCVNRFDDETKQSFLELYDKVDADFQMPTGSSEKEVRAAFASEEVF